MKGQEWYQAEDVAEAYDDKRFSQGGRLINDREKQAVLDAVAPVEDKKMLEIACGTGRFTAMLAELGANIVGLDISAAMLQQGRERAQAAGVDNQLEYLRGDAARLPFPDNHFDTVIAMRFFHLMDEPEPFIKEMRRVASDQIFFDTFNRTSARSLYTWALPMGSRLYSRTEVSRLLGAAELTLVNAEHDWVFPYGFYRELPNALASGFRKLDNLIGGTPAGRPLASVSYWDTRV
ncbi:class I SAM-dependent methyltransferase [Halovenus salina]|uniref:Class I SAM-dependent methyltransferase n=1 Tax=Halovenus salina TaxID=1510225 RepID=A0ABD5W5Y6_9EURY|nr:class I SAM-dependent methyltransferase [Halovenus salina]